MALLSFLRRLSSRPAAPRRKQRRRGARPFLEILEDRTLLSTFVVNNTFDDGIVRSNTLRVAITLANATPGPDTIQFQIPTTDLGYDAASGVWTIRPRSGGLPAIADPVTIDGTTSPGGAP